ncbi:MAG TPA: EAL domain-containing protein [Acidimicrobiales bacterium]|nr:EAL domain-containing protein [Acidimicrobiales bacterium]
MAVLDIVVGRQPVFDRELAVVGYELLFRTLEGTGFSDQLDGDLMTTSVLFSSVGIGVNKLVGDKVIFCNADRGLLTGSVPVVLAPERTVFEVIESVALDDEVVAGCERLVHQGFMLALDHFRWVDGVERLLELASIVKIDLQLVPDDKLGPLMEQCRKYDVSLVAEKVETQGQLKHCQDLGFDYFQGYLLSRPRIVPGRTLDSSSVARLQLAAQLASSECSASQLEEIIRAEPAMAYQLLQMAGVGADHGFRRRVQTLREALVIVGWRQLQSWIGFLILTNKGETSEEEVVTTLTRARMTELLALEMYPHLSGLAFAAGMLSAFDLLLGVRLEEVLISLPLDAELHDAVLGKDTEVGRVVADVIDCQLGRPEEATRCALDEQVLHRASIKALGWALEVSRGFVRTSRPAKLRRKPAPSRS